jgi:hypothetical protein
VPPIEQVAVNQDDRKLLPCPFCGSEAGLGRGRDGPFVNCIDCLASTNILVPQGQTEAEAIAAWNTRTSVPLPTLTGEVERLRTALIEAGRSAGALLADEVSTDFLMLIPDEVKAALTRQQIQLEELREALEPFAEIARRAAVGETDLRTLQWELSREFDADHFIRARKALGVS